MTWTDPAQLQAYREELAALSERVDYLVASHHWGFRTEVLAYQTEIARAAIDAGADAVLGHGPHFALGVELYRGKPIFYGACNFSFNRGHREDHMEWLGYFATIRSDSDGVAEIDLRLVRRNAANETLLRAPTDEPDAVDGLVAQSASFGTRLTVAADRLVVWQRDR